MLVLRRRLSGRPSLPLLEARDGPLLRRPPLDLAVKLRCRNRLRRWQFLLLLHLRAKTLSSLFPRPQAVAGVSRSQGTINEVASIEVGNPPFLQPMVVGAYLLIGSSG